MEFFHETRMIPSESILLFLTQLPAINKRANSIDSAILDRIRTGPENHVWTPPDFHDLGSRAAVDKALSRNCKNGSVCRAGRGLYHVLRNHPTLGPLGPSYDAIQDLVQRKSGGDVFPTGAHAANVLGLSDQVPVRSWYRTTGPIRRIGSGKSEIILRHVSSRFVSTKNPKSAQVILAIRRDLIEAYIVDGMVALTGHPFSIMQTHINFFYETRH